MIPSESASKFQGLMQFPALWVKAGGHVILVQTPHGAELVGELIFH